MNQRIPFLEELKQDLMEHAPQQKETASAPLRPRFQWKGPWVAAAVFIVVVTLGGLSWILSGDISPDTTVDEPVTQLGPGLMWQQVEAPEQVARVRSLWSLPEGFALWTGAEIWTSPDGEDWRLAASAPPITDTNHENVVAHIDDRWLVAGADDSGTPLIAATSDGSTWTSSPLPVPSLTNELLASRVEVVAVVSGPDGVVAVGAVTTGVDEEAVMERFAPDLTGGEIRFRDGAIDIVESDGTVRTSVPFEDISPRLADQRHVILDTIIWQSPDAQSWNQVDLIENAGPGFIGANTDGYIVPLVKLGSPGTPIYTSSNGVDWSLLTELQEPILGGSFALLDETLIVGAPPVSLLRVELHDGTTQLVSAGPAFDNTDLADLRVGQVAAGPYGVLAAAYDGSRGSVPYTTLWYSPDGQQWNRQRTNDIFGTEANLKVAVGADRVVVATDPQGEGGLPLESPFQVWIGTISNQN